MFKILVSCLMLSICHFSFVSANIDYKNRSISINCAPELQHLLMTIQKIPEARDLIVSVYQEGSFAIKSNDNPAVSEQFGACWDPDNRVIYVDASPRRSKGEIIGSIIFELHNAVITSKFDHYDHLAATGKIDRESYVQAIERLEYENSIKAAKIAEKGIQMGYFPANAKLPTYQNFEEHYHYQKIGGHSSWIARNYDYHRNSFFN